LTPLVVEKSGDYLIAPFEQSAGVRALILSGGTKKLPATYSVEYRQPLGYDAYQPFAPQAFQGAVVHVAPIQSGGATLLELTASPNPIIDTPALTVGQTWCEDGGRLSLTPLSATSTGLTVRISLGHCSAK
jgi:hypothetical protein